MQCIAAGFSLAPIVGYSCFYRATRSRWEEEPPGGFAGFFIMEFEVPWVFASAFAGFLFAQASPNRWTRLVLSVVNIALALFWVVRIGNAQ
ncbi:MAG: hypothetical protein AAF488_01560 [Planctomycetota bacterium]